jgi:hypothetical protein
VWCAGVERWLRVIFDDQLNRFGCRGPVDPPGQRQRHVDTGRDTRAVDERFIKDDAAGQTLTPIEARTSRNAQCVVARRPARIPAAQYHQPSVGPDRVRPGRDEMNLSAGPAGDYLVWSDQIERRELVIEDNALARGPGARS